MDNLEKLLSDGYKRLINKLWGYNLLITKTCNLCNETKPIDKFCKGRVVCKVCINSIRTKGRYKDRVRNYNLKKKFDLTLKEYKQLLKQQDRVCAICGKTPKQNKKALAVDHDHKVKKEYNIILIRGLLCTSCNRYVIGLMKDNKTVFAGVIKYLTKALEDYSKFMKRRYDERI